MLIQTERAQTHNGFFSMSEGDPVRLASIEHDEHSVFKKFLAMWPEDPVEVSDIKCDNGFHFEPDGVGGAAYIGYREAPILTVQDAPVRPLPDTVTGMIGTMLAALEHLPYGLLSDATLDAMVEARAALLQCGVICVA